MNRRSLYSAVFTLLVFAAAGCAKKGPEQLRLDQGAPEELQDAAKDCDLGSHFACHNLGLAYLHGPGVARDEPHAMELFRVACAAGADLSCSVIVSMENSAGAEAGDGAEALAAAGVEARQMMEARCERGIPEACDRWAEELHRSGRGPEGLELATRRCAEAPATNCVIAGGMLEELGRADEARDLYARSCAAGVVLACRLQADADTRGLEGDPPRETFALYTRACQSNDGLACYALALLYSNGSGEREDATYAAELRAEACTLGVAEACGAGAGPE